MQAVAAKLTAKAFAQVLKPLGALEEPKHLTGAEAPQSCTGESKMKIAVPIANGQLAMHFGHCEQFAIFEIDQNSKKITSSKNHTPPAHEPGVLPKWLAEQGASVIIAGGMGSRAQSLFSENSIEVVIGAPDGSSQEIVEGYLAGSLVTGGNICDH
jgi:ATP-binding protein involved in chromosome partitioning